MRSAPLAADGEVPVGRAARRGRPCASVQDVGLVAQQLPHRAVPETAGAPLDQRPLHRRPQMPSDRLQPARPVAWASSSASYSEPAAAVDRSRPGRSPPAIGRAGDDDAVVGEHRRPVASPIRAASSAPRSAVVDLAGVLVDEDQLAVEHGRGLVDDLGQQADRGQHGRRGRGGCGSPPRASARAPVQLGVDVERPASRPTCPRARRRPVLTRHTSDADTSSHHSPHGLIHSDAPSSAHDRDVAGDVLAEPAAGQDPEGARQLLADVEVDTDRRHEARGPRRQSPFAHRGHATPRRRSGRAARTSAPCPPGSGAGRR